MLLKIAQTGGFSDRLGDFMAELTKRLKLAPVAQILVALSLVDSCREDLQGECMHDLIFTNDPLSISHKDTEA